MNNNRILAPIIITCSLLILTGCASVKPRVVSIEIGSDQPGMEVWTMPIPQSVNDFIVVRNYEWPNDEAPSKKLGLTPYTTELIIARPGGPPVTSSDGAESLLTHKYYRLWIPFVFAEYKYTLGLRYALRKSGCQDTVIDKTLSIGNSATITDPFHLLAMLAERPAYVDAINGLAKEIKEYTQTGYKITPEIVGPIKTNHESNSDKLRGLKRMIDEGLISQEEYKAKRKQILDNM